MSTEVHTTHLWQDNFVPSKATPEVKEKFIKAVIALVYQEIFSLFIS